MLRVLCAAGGLPGVLPRLRLYFQPNEVFLGVSKAIVGTRWWCFYGFIGLRIWFDFALCDVESCSRWHKIFEKIRCVDNSWNSIEFFITRLKFSNENELGKKVFNGSVITLYLATLNFWIWDWLLVEKYHNFITKLRLSLQELLDRKNHCHNALERNILESILSKIINRTL